MILEKPSEGTEMSDAAYAQGLVYKLAEPVLIGDNVKGQIDRAYKRLVKALERAGKQEERKRWKWRRVKAFWYMEVPDHAIRTHETRELELAAALHDARKAHAEYLAENARLATMLAVTDPAFHGPEIERLGGFAGGMDRPGVGGGDE